MLLNTFRIAMSPTLYLLCKEDFIEIHHVTNVGPFERTLSNIAYVAYLSANQSSLNLRAV